jgi:transmembrane sensor
MSGTVEIRSVNATEIERQAADWLQRRRYWKEWSDTDQAGLDAWLAESVTHNVAYWRLEAVLERAERLSVLRPQNERTRGIASGRFLRASLKAVFVLAVLALCGTGAMLLLPGPRGQTYATTLGGHTLIKLTDGSRIELNTSTVVHADITTKRRYVSIDRGEAYFDIVHDPKRPFIVEVAGHRITDLGTKFIVRKDAGRVELTLVEGRASIMSTDASVQAHSAILTRGEVAVATTDSISIEEKSSIAMQKELSWRRGLLVFENARLTEVAAELNRYNSKKLVIAGDAVGGLTIDASVPTDGILAFTRVAQDVFGLRVEDRGNEVVISR